MKGKELGFELGLGLGLGKEGMKWLPLQDKEGTTLGTFLLFERMEDDRLDFKMHWMKF